MRYLIIYNIFVTLFSACVSAPKAAPAPPYPPSQIIDDIAWDFNNLLRMAPGSDLWPTTWAADDNIYTSWGDGGGFEGTNSDGRVSLGFARIEGVPENFSGHNVWGGKDSENPAIFDGKSGGMLSVDGVLYAWINLQNGIPWDQTLAWSSDFAATWQKESWVFPGVDGGFSPKTFLNFGKDYAGARDEYVYIYGKTWGDSINAYLARVSKDQIRILGAYEFFKGLDGNGKPVWTSDVTQRLPFFTDPNGVSGPTVVYNLKIQRYLLTTSHGGVGELGIFEAPEPWGPWKTVAYYENWGGFHVGEALRYSFPTKWIDSTGKTMWMVFSSTGELDSFNLLKASLILGERSSTKHLYLPMITSGVDSFDWYYDLSQN